MTIAKYQQPTQDGRRPSESAPVIYKNKLDILHEAGGATLIKLRKVPIKLLSFNFFLLLLPPSRKGPRDL